MKNPLLQQSPNRKATLGSIALSLVCALNLAVFTTAADAACRPTGKIVAGRSVLKCTGSTRCRPTGRYKTVRGVRYQLLNCPR
jgi:hypothetical protein